MSLQGWQTHSIKVAALNVGGMFNSVCGSKMKANKEFFLVGNIISIKAPCGINDLDVRFLITG